VGAGVVRFDRMRVLQPVLWSKGTFLTPQHLQAQDRFIESVLQFRVESLNFRPWGFTSLKLDHEALDGGMAGVKQASGLFPDGTPFEIPESDEAPKARPLAEFFAQGQTSVDVFLSIPEYRQNTLNVTAPGTTADARYVAEIKTWRDENNGVVERPVQVARRNLRVVVEGENRQGQVLLRMARIRKTEAETFEFDPAAVPAILNVKASDALTRMSRRLLEILSAKSSMLAALRRQKNQSLAEFTTGDIANFWLLYSVNQHLPLVRHIYESRGGHPEELWNTMASLASVLTTFSLEVQPKDLPVYDHDELGERFATLEERLLHLLETVVPSNFISLPLKLVRPSIYAATLNEDRYLRNTRMYLAVSAEVEEVELIQKGPHLIKVCSATHVEHLVRQALPGVTMLHQTSPPSSIPLKLNHQYFSLSQSGLAWEAIERARNIAAYVPGDFPNPTVELIILLPTS
jgi:type VI secretion system protein ImpJ